MYKRKIHSDIFCGLSNPEYFVKEMNIWDGILDDEKKRMPQSFIIGSIRVFSTNASFFWSTKLDLGDKIYNLLHYMIENNPQEAAIYDFEKGWLAPLKIPSSFDKPIMLQVPPQSSVSVSISVVW